MPWVIEGGDVELPEFTFTPETTFTGGVLGDFQAWMTNDAQSYLTALASLFEDAYGIVVAQGDPETPDLYEAGWSILLDPTECPTQFLPYLAQFVGAQVQPNTDDATARNQIVNLAAQHRGTKATLLAAAQTQLSGDQTVFMLERQNLNGQPDAYHLVILFFQSELLTNVQAIANAVELVKPAGIQITYSAITGYVWNLAIHNWAADTMTWSQTAIQQP